MDVVRVIFLSTIDKYWTEHLTGIEDLREGINLRGYAQLDPLVEYKNEAYSMFERLNADINFEATRRLFMVQVEAHHDAPLQKEPTKGQPLVFKSASSVDPFTQAQHKEKVVGSQSSVVAKDKNVSQPTTDYRPPSTEQQTGFRIIPPGQTSKKPGRNDLCWCGSGKKYKKCHYPN